jgi:hypothetical protein
VSRGFQVLQASRYQRRLRAPGGTVLIASAGGTVEVRAAWDCTDADWAWACEVLAVAGVELRGQPEPGSDGWDKWTVIPDKWTVIV